MQNTEQTNVQNLNDPKNDPAYWEAHEDMQSPLDGINDHYFGNDKTCKQAWKKFQKALKEFQDARIYYATARATWHHLDTEYENIKNELQNWQNFESETEYARKQARFKILKYLSDEAQMRYSQSWGQYYRAECKAKRLYEDYLNTLEQPQNAGRTDNRAGFTKGTKAIKTSSEMSKKKVGYVSKTKTK